MEQLRLNLLKKLFIKKETSFVPANKMSKMLLFISARSEKKPYTMLCRKYFQASITLTASQGYAGLEIFTALKNILKPTTENHDDKIINKLSGVAKLMAGEIKKAIADDTHADCFI